MLLKLSLRGENRDYESTLASNIYQEGNLITRRYRREDVN